MDVFDAAEKYCESGQQVIILAGKEYGSGSSRDWAAKGPWMLVSTACAATNSQPLECFYLRFTSVK